MHTTSQTSSWIQVSMNRYKSKIHGSPVSLLSTSHYPFSWHIDRPGCEDPGVCLVVGVLFLARLACLCQGNSYSDSQSFRHISNIIRASPMLSNTLDMPPISFVPLQITFAHMLHISRYHGYHSHPCSIIMYVSLIHSYLLRLSMTLRDAQNPFFAISNAFPIRAKYTEGANIVLKFQHGLQQSIQN
jgi:hypothetical protein